MDDKPENSISVAPSAFRTLFTDERSVKDSLMGVFLIKLVLAHGMKKLPQFFCIEAEQKVHGPASTQASIRHRASRSLTACRSGRRFLGLFFASAVPPSARRVKFLSGRASELRFFHRFSCSWRVGFPCRFMSIATCRKLARWSYLFRSLPKVLDESTQQTLLACARYAHPTARAFASTVKVIASLTLACGV